MQLRGMKPLSAISGESVADAVSRPWLEWSHVSERDELKRGSVGGDVHRLVEWVVGGNAVTRQDGSGSERMTE